MLALFKKELFAFLGSLTGHVVLLTFLVLMGLFLWILPGDFNLPDSGFASLDGLFLLAPWVFLFLIPAITMRSFAEEKRSGTMELLLTMPLSSFEIVMGKFLAGWVLVALALLPCSVYYYLVYAYGNPPGNLDTAAIFGSAIGLFFLASGFLGIGLFASAISPNQILSFVFATLISLFFFLGFEALAGLPFLKGIDHLLLSLGIQYHYVSLSRGVIDSRDLLYFGCLGALFLYLTMNRIRPRR